MRKTTYLTSVMGSMLLFGAATAHVGAQGAYDQPNGSYIDFNGYSYYHYQPNWGYYYTPSNGPGSYQPNVYHPNVYQPNFY